jgi:hypothetical protein
MYSVRILDRSRQTLAVFHADVRWYFNRRINEAGQMTIWIPREEASQWPMFTENKGSYAQMAYYAQIYKDTTLKAAGKITGRDFTEEYLVVQALTEEVLLENIVCPAQYGMVWDNQDIADVARDLLDNWYAARVKDQTEWEACVESENIDTTTEPGVVMLAKDDTGAYLPSGYIVLHFNQKAIADFYLGAPLGEHETSPFKSWGRIRWASDNGGEVKTTMQYSDDGETWSEEIEGAFPDQVGVDPGWSDEEEDVYVRINLYTSDTTSEDDEGNPVGQTPFVFAVEMLARVSSDILSSSIPLETGMTVKGLVADGENALAILREACENVHAGPAGMTGSEKYEFYVQNGVLYLVSEIGSDQTDECVFRAGTNTEINKLSDDDEKLCNVLLARGKGDGINRLQKEFRDYDSIAEYGEYRKVVDFDVDDITDLTTKAEAYLEEFATPVVAFSIQTMFPINAEPSYGLGDYVRVVDPKTGVVSTVRIMQETREYTENGLSVHLELGRPAVNLNDAIGWEPPIRQVETLRPAAPWARPIIQGIVTGFNRPSTSRWHTTEVHLSTTPGFTITGETLVKVAKQNKFEILDLEGGERYYIKFVNIDSDGNRSEESSEVSALVLKANYGEPGGTVANSVRIDAKIEDATDTVNVYVRWKGLVGSYSEWYLFDSYPYGDGEYSNEIDDAETLPLIGQSMANLFIDVKFELPSDAIDKTKLRWFVLWINSAQFIFDSEADFRDNMSSDSQDVEIGSDIASPGDPYVRPDDFEITGIYIMSNFIEKEGTVIVNPPVENGVFGVLIHVGEVYFPGDDISNAVQEVFHNKNIDPERYCIIIGETIEEEQLGAMCYKKGPRVVQQKRDSVIFELFADFGGS